MSKQPEIKIALADDHVMVRKGIKEIISSFGGFDIIIEASDGEELINLIKSVNVLPDICVLDINMPNKNGYDTLKGIKELWPSVKFLILTMFNNEFNIMRMLKEGAHGFLLKNSDPKDLETALHSIYTAGHYHSPLLSARAFKALNNEHTNFPQITDKEMQFLSLCCSNMTYKDMGDKLNLSQRTVEGYRDSLFKKLDLNTRTALAMYAISIGLTPYTEE